jgi:hypothetical protein
MRSQRGCFSRDPQELSLSRVRSCPGASAVSVAESAWLQTFKVIEALL